MHVTEDRSDDKRDVLLDTSSLCDVSADSAGDEVYNYVLHSLRGRGRAIVNQTNAGTVSKATLGETPERTGWSVYGPSRAIYIPY